MHRTSVENQVKRYILQLTKTIIVNVEARTEKEAIDRITNEDDDFDGAWTRAEPRVESLGESDE
jgi:hypothetical protein